LNNSNHHCFALFCRGLSDFLAIGDQQYKTTDKDLLHRIVVVLRMQVADRCILFDRDSNVLCSIGHIDKKEVVFTILNHEKNVPLRPFIRLYLPVLKRNHLEDAVSLAGQVGVSEIQLITTQRSLRTHVRDDRLESIMIGACEQAKQFVIPHIYQPIALPYVFEQDSLKHSFVCAHDGMPFSLLQKTLENNVQKQWECNLFVGPEQDFTPNEYALFTEKNIPLVSLGSVVLQASVAACVCVALLRASFISKK
jgi:16S rRNA (uracil1498-N3)-methyltransferase